MKKQNWYVNQKQYHFIYKTTCKVNGKYYLGMHSTDSLEDGYIGSGTKLWHSIKKHGRENFSIEILEFLPDRESLKHREAMLINEETLNDPLCLNLRTGGEGGWPDPDSLSAEAILKIEEGRKLGATLGGAAARKAWNEKVACGEVKHQTEGRILTDEQREKISLACRGRKPSLTTLGKPRSEATKQKIRETFARKRAVNANNQRSRQRREASNLQVLQSR